MGRVKELWQEERDKKFAELVAKYINDGYDLLAAEDMAKDDMEAEDVANGQFGVGA